MVTSPNEYRWDFLGLSTDAKPTAETSENVTNGSTYYEADTSKLYIYYDGTWYEKESTGGGGGGKVIDLPLTFDFNNNTVTTSKTVSEIINYYNQGICFMSTGVFDPTAPICLQIMYGVLTATETGYLLTGFTHSPEEVTRIEFTATNLTDHFVAALSH